MEDMFKFGKCVRKRGTNQDSFGLLKKAKLDASNSVAEDVCSQAKSADTGSRPIDSDTACTRRKQWWIPSHWWKQAARYVTSKRNRRHADASHSIHASSHQASTSRPSWSNDNGTASTRRQWETINHGDTKQPTFPFTVMTYNVLAQDLIKANHYLYEHCQPEVLAWSSRSERLYDEIRHHSPDVVCLQEVQKNHYSEFFKPKLKALGLIGQFKKRTNEKPDGCATFVRVSKFTVETSIAVEYRRGDILDRDNIAIVTKLTPNCPALEKTSLVIANTHLLFNPRRGDVKLAQMCVLLAELNKLIDACDSRPPVILCGDFNSEPFSDLYRFLVDGRLSYRRLQIAHISGQREGRLSSNGPVIPSLFPPPSLGISEKCRYIDETETDAPEPDGNLRHSLGLATVYQYGAEGSDPQQADVTTHHGRTSCAVDYILYSRTPRLCPLARYGLLPRHVLSRVPSLPNRTFPSDHLCLIAKFSIDP